MSKRLGEGAGGLPPKRLKWTVILVATDGSAKPVISCAAKMLRGLCLRASTHDQASDDSCYDTALALVNPEEVFAIHVEHMQALKVVNVHGH